MGRLTEAEIDVIVAGGGPSGLIASTAAARLGVRTLLIEREGFLGGNATAGLVAQFFGFFNGDRQVVRGIPEEFTERIKKSGGSTGFEPYLLLEATIKGTPHTDRGFPFNPEIVKIVADELVTDAGARILFHTQVAGALMEGERITGLACEGVAGRREIHGKVIVDATGDAVAAKRAGAEVMGEEEGLRKARAPVTLIFRLTDIDLSRLRALPREEKQLIVREGLAKGEILWESLGFFRDLMSRDAFGRSPVGTGPYKFVRYASGEYIDLERFDGYWGSKPSVKEVRFLFVPEDTTRVSKLKAGEVDIIGACPYPVVRDIEKTPGLKTVKLSTGHPTPSVVIATQNPKVPWYDKRVRLAMAMAIDRNAIVKNVLFGIPDQFSFLAPYELGSDPGLKPYPYNPKEAKQLLAEAGYSNGFELNLYWMVTGRFPMSREIAESVAAYFEAVGIRARLIGEEFMAGTNRQRAAKGPDAVYVAFAMHGRAGSPDPTYYLELFFGKEGTFSTYFNPEVDTLIAQARTMADDAKRAEVIKKAVRIVHDDVASIPIFNAVAVYAMKQNVDFKPTQKSARDLILVKDITVR